MPLQINELNIAIATPPPAWFVPVAAQITQMASDIAAHTKTLAQMQQRLDELTELVRQGQKR